MLSAVDDRPPVNGFAEYIWRNDKGDLVSKTRSISVFFDQAGNFVPQFPRWHQGEFLLSACHYTNDPLRREPSFLVLCEQRDRSDQAIGSRADLRSQLFKNPPQARIGFRQSFLYSGQIDVNLPYLLTDANLCYHSSGTNWFQLQFEEENVDQEILTICDHLLLGRYLVERAAQKAICWDGLVLLTDKTETDNFWTPPYVLHDYPYPLKETETSETDPYVLARRITAPMATLSRAP